MARQRSKGVVGTLGAAGIVLSIVACSSESPDSSARPDQEVAPPRDTVVEEPHPLIEGARELLPAGGVSATATDRFTDIVERHELEDGQGDFVGASFLLSLQDITVARGYTMSAAGFGEDEGSTVVAPDGHELVVARFAEPGVLAPPLFPPDSLRPLVDASLTELVVETQVQDEEPRLLEDEDFASEMVLVASVPAGRAIWLRVSDSPLPDDDSPRPFHAINLRTGAVGGDLPPFSLTSTWATELNFPYAGQGRSFDHLTAAADDYAGRGEAGDPSLGVRDVSVELTLGAAVLVPWHYQHGYPTNGAWLHFRDAVDVVGELQVCGRPGENATDDHGRLDLERSTAFQLVAEDGTTYQAEPGGDPSRTTLVGAPLLFDVPAGFRNGTLIIRPAAGTEWLMGGRVWRVPPPEATVEVRLTEREVIAPDDLRGDYAAGACP